MFSVYAPLLEAANYESWNSCSKETRELVTLAVNGLGGAEALSRLHSIRRVGSVTESSARKKEVTKFERVWIAPQDLYIRMEQNGTESQFALGPAGAHLFPGDPRIRGSAIRLTDDEVATFLAPVKDDPIHILINRGNLAYGFEAGETRTFEGQNVRILHVVAEAREFEWWVSLDTGRIVKIRRDDSESIRRDFREARGLIVPFDMLSTAADGSTCRTILDSIEVNNPATTTARFPRPELVVMRLKVQPSGGSRSYYPRNGQGTSSSSTTSSSRSTFLDDPRIPVSVGDHYWWGSR
jgi:hypothetical protein